MGKIETIARGVYVADSCLLVCHTKGANNSYLPGGHIEFRESASASLAREIDEEMGLVAHVGEFLGVVEHTFKQRGKRKCELNLVFEMDIPDLRPPTTPPSCEDYIEFRWLPLAELDGSDLEPEPLRVDLPRWLNAGPSHFASTHEPSDGS